MLNNDWGMEAWVKASSATPGLSTDGYAMMVGNGNSLSNGMGIVQTPGGQFIGVVGGVGLVGGADVTPGVWTHLALVDAGGQTTFYVNGVPTGTGGSPNAPNGSFSIGINPAVNGGAEPFQGSIDEVRVFSFTPGLFSTNDLLLTSAAPAPSVGILPAANNVIVLWKGETLQGADNLNGPWNMITNATVPWLAPAVGTSQFFRAANGPQ